jgi:hypothetical protein
LKSRWDLGYSDSKTCTMLAQERGFHGYEKGALGLGILMMKEEE